MSERMYIAIDLKSFFASVECVERGLDPLSAKLVVADASRTEKTICLAVSPALKKYGIPGRARLFEVIQKCNEVKATTGETIDYIVATPHMQKYMDYSSRIFRIYQKYVSETDIHVYSIDEVFIDVTDYLHLYKDDEGNQVTAHGLAMMMIRDVLKNTGITATAGIGTNMYLAKIAMDIVAKHAEPDADGVRIAQLDVMSYRRLLWEHKPLTDFWRVGKGTVKKLAANGIYTMGDIARLSVSNVGYGNGEDLLYKLFGVDAELLIDHAWGIEPCGMKHIKNYKTSSNSISQGQVLHCGYDYRQTRIIVKEMLELLVLDIVSKKLVTDSVVLDLGFDRDFDTQQYDGPLALDPYGRIVPKPVHGSHRLKRHTSSTESLMTAVLEIYDRIMNKDLLVRRLSVTLCNVKNAEKQSEDDYVQMSLFDECTDGAKAYAGLDVQAHTGSIYEGQAESINAGQKLEREKRLQEAMLKIQGKFGKNAILKGTNLCEGATAIERNQQIGGHKM